MAPRSVPESNAVWVGQVDLQTLALLAADERLVLDGGVGYQSAKIALRDGKRMLGFTLTEVEEGQLPAAFASSVLAKHTPEVAASANTDLPFFTVAIATRERPEDLRGALQSVFAVDYPHFEVVVVDNAPTTDGTRRMLAEEYPQVNYILEPVKGASKARNTAIENAKGDYIAFIDDDVIVDRYWLRTFADVFAANQDVWCITGLVPSGELATKTQLYFDNRVTWGSLTEARIYQLGETYADVPAFPFSVGAYGTGASFAMDKRLGLKFDEALGPGRLTGGGEDIDLFFRVLQTGHALAVTPDAIAWHRHRATEDALLSQTHTYGRGLGAWLTKVALTPKVWPQIVRTVAPAVKRFRHLGGENAVQDERLLPVNMDLDRSMRSIEKRAILGGPASYLMGRLKGAASV